ncbi:MAG TPA: helix-turn-helix transcriptional regulator [Jatrophihabitantaceae bacterium]|jgi:predicted transcriptional regulator
MTAIYTRAQARRLLPPPPDRRRIRLDAGASQAEVAAESGVNQSSVHRWELGTTTPRGSHLVAYVDVLLRLSAITGVPQ